jgi:hypothetical protein
MSKETLSSAKVREIVGEELSGMPAELSGRIGKYLVEPNLSERTWAYGPEIFRCWIVLTDNDSGTGIAFVSRNRNRIADGYCCGSTAVGAMTILVRIRAGSVPWRMHSMTRSWVNGSS